MKAKVFSCFLRKLAQMEQKLYGVSSFEAGLLATILTKANLFRRFPTGCTTQELCFCSPRYVQELLVYICLSAKENGSKLRSIFEFTQTIVYAPGMWGQPCVEDRDVSLFLETVFPEVKTKKEIDRKLYAELLPEIPESEWEDKFVQLSNFRQVNIEALDTSEADEEAALIDAVFAELENDAVLQQMLLSGGRSDMYGKSPAYKVYMQNVSEFPKAY